MDVTKPYKFIRFGAMYVTKPYKFIGFGDIDVTNTYKCIGFGDIYQVLLGPKYTRTRVHQGIDARAPNPINL